MTAHYPTTWDELKTIMEGSLSPGDRIIPLAPLTATSTITPASNGADGNPIWLLGPSPSHRVTIFGGTDIGSFQWTNRSHWNVRNFYQTGGSQFATFSGTCSYLDFVSIEGTAWTHSNPTATQFWNAGGGTRVGCRIAACDGYGSPYDYFSTAGSWGWLIEFCYVHDLGTPGNETNGLTDAFAFHNSNGGFSTLRYNRIENIIGKAGISLASDDPTPLSTSGSWGYCYGNVISGCRYGILGGGDNSRLVAWDNYVVVEQIVDSMGDAIGENNTFGMGSLSLDLPSPAGYCYMYNNHVVNHGGDANVVCYAYRMSTPFQMVNCSSYCTGVESYFYYIAANAAQDPGNVLRNNCHWSTTGDQGRIRFGASYDLTIANIQGFGGEVDSLNVDPEVRDVTGNRAVDAAPVYGSPLLGAGFDLSASFTTDIAGLTFDTWNIGPWSIPVPDPRASRLTIQVERDEIECRI